MEDPGNYSQVHLTSVPCNITKQILLENMPKSMKDSKVIRYSHHAFIKGKLCLTKPVAFSDQVTTSADKGRAIEVIYLDFCKALVESLTMS